MKLCGFCPFDYLLKVCVSPLQPHALLQRVKSCISDEEEEKLMQITSLHSLNAFLLPIKTVGVQVIQLLEQFTKPSRTVVLSVQCPAKSVHVIFYNNKIIKKKNCSHSDKPQNCWL